MRIPQTRLLLLSSAEIQCALVDISPSPLLFFQHDIFLVESSQDLRCLPFASPPFALLWQACAPVVRVLPAGESV